MQLQFVCDKGDELRIRWLSFGVGNRIPKEPLERIQIPSVPGHFDGVTDGSLDAGRRCAECLCHLGVQYLGDGVGVLSARLGGLPEAREL